MFRTSMGKLMEMSYLDVVLYIEVAMDVPYLKVQGANLEMVIYEGICLEA